MTNPSDIPWERLAPYLTGELPADQAQDIERWITASPEHRALVEELRVVWGRAAELPEILEPVDVHAAWNRAAVRVAADAAPAVRSRRALTLVPLSSSKQSQRQMSWVWGIAAALMVAAGAGMLWRHDIVGRDGAVVVQPRTDWTHMTARGERGAVTLPDGTRLVLAPDSRLRVRDGLRGATRKVELEGAAFFQVAHDPAHPFLVHSAGTVTRVIGTEFSVTAYPGEDQVRVLVKSGKVAIGRGAREAAVLTRGHFARLDRTGMAVVDTGVDVERALAWITGQLDFTRQTFGQVVPQLERWYNLEINVTDRRLAERQLSASFQDETPDQVLAAIALLIGAHAERSGSTVTFSPIRPSSPARSQ